MRKIKWASMLAVAALAVASFISCEEKAPTALDQSTAANSKVTGFVTYTYAINSGAKQEKAPANTKVIVETAVEYDAEGNAITFATQTVKVNAQGKYEAKVAIPAGKTAKIKVFTNFEADNYSVSTDDNGGSSTVKTEFYGESDANVRSGETYVLNIKATAKGAIGEAYFKDAKGN
mgnify:CR=1 FL=1